MAKRQAVKYYAQNTRLLHDGDMAVITVRLPKNLKAHWEQTAAEEGKSLNLRIVELLQEAQ